MKPIDEEALKAVKKLWEKGYDGYQTVLAIATVLVVNGLFIGQSLTPAPTGKATRTQVLTLHIEVRNLGPVKKIARYEWRDAAIYDGTGKEWERRFPAEESYILTAEPMPEVWELFSRKKSYERREKEAVTA